MKKAKSENQLVIFVKYPELGKVKTRLAGDIGNQKAVKIYSLIAKYITERLSASKSYTTNIFYSPPERESDVKNWLQYKGVEFYPQDGTNLGKKMRNAIHNLLSCGAKNVVVVGSDCIDISAETIEYCFNQLKHGRSDVVIGPSVDGGYYLLGLKALHETLFEGIEWSSEKVFSQTIEKLENKNLSYMLLEELNDIDVFRDIDISALKKIDRNLAEQISIAFYGTEGEKSELL